MLTIQESLKYLSKRKVLLTHKQLWYMCYKDRLKHVKKSGILWIKETHLDSFASKFEGIKNGRPRKEITK